MPVVDASPVRELLRSWTAVGHESGAAVAVIVDDEVVVDEAVGWADVSGRRPFAPTTLVHVYSVSKPVTTLAALYACRTAQVPLEGRVADCWPAYGAAGKAATTVRDLLAHRAGLPAWPSWTAATIHDAAGLRDALAAAAPEWPPGAGHGEHALTYGHLVEGLLLGATGVGLGPWLARFAAAVGIPDLFLGVPADQLDRVADVVTPRPDWAAAVLGPAGTAWHRSLAVPPGALDPAVINSRAWRTGVFGSIGLHTTARALATLYADLLRPTGRVAAAIGPAAYAAFLTPTFVGPDQLFGMRASWGLGIPVETSPTGAVTWFGMGGVGGSLAYAAPPDRLAFAYVTRHLADGDRADAVASRVTGLVSRGR